MLAINPDAVGRSLFRHGIDSLVRVEDVGGGAEERELDLFGQIGLILIEPVAIHDLEPGNPELLTRFFHPLQSFEFAGKGNHQFTHRNEREVEDLCMLFVEHVSPHGKARLECSWITLKTCVNNAAVGLGNPEAQLSLFFEEHDTHLVLGEFVGQGCAHNAAAYDEDICLQGFSLNQKP